VSTQTLLNVLRYGSHSDVRTSSIARWKARDRLADRDNWTFLLALTADALIRRKHLCWRGWVTLRLNIRLKGYIYPQHIYTVRWGNGPATTLLLEVFTQRKSLFHLNSFLFTKMTNLLFLPPIAGLSGNVRASSIARWKARGRLPIRDSWTFWLALTVETF